MRQLITTLMVLLTAGASAQSVDSTFEQRMSWFEEGRLGIFIHWGIYAVNGVDESWSFYNHKISYEDYISQLSGFTADRYDPDSWARLIKASGAHYAVLTAKHHDGVALWDTKAGLALPGYRGRRGKPRIPWLSVPARTPAGRDVLTPFTDALRRHDIKVGVYYSLIDWSYPDYPGFLKDSSRYSIEEDPARWQRFRDYNMEQLRELMNRQNPDLWWFDGGWEHSAEEWDSESIFRMLFFHNPDVIINDRLPGGGDYGTPEQHFPVFRPEKRYWELCQTTNNNWGYQHADTNFKSPAEVISIFTEVISKGGNLLLDIGPKADGTIPAEQEMILTELGNWISRNKSAIYGTLGGVEPHYCGFPTTLSRDSLTMYVFVPRGTQGPIVIKGINPNIRSAELLSTGQPVHFILRNKLSWSSNPGVWFLSIPPTETEPYQSVIRITFDQPLTVISPH